VRRCEILWFHPACGHIPEEQQDEPPDGEHPPLPHAGPEDDFPIEIPPIADICFSVDVAPQDGQGICLLRSPVTNSSNLFPHFVHRYSKIGIQNPFKIRLFFIKQK
jgi:hypothetical protein